MYVCCRFFVRLHENKPLEKRNLRLYFASCTPCHNCKELRFVCHRCARCLCASKVVRMLGARATLGAVVNTCARSDCRPCNAARCVYTCLFSGTCFPAGGKVVARVVDSYRYGAERSYAACARSIYVPVCPRA